jgi:hypothetical protein
MTTQVVEVWEQFQSILNRYGRVYSYLNPPCSPDQILAAESLNNIAFPEALISLLCLNNGQQIGNESFKLGIFKSFSGWDAYKRHLFLGVDEIGTAYQTFISDPVLLSEFGTNEIPFAVAGSPTQFSEAFCIHSLTGAVSLIWTEYVDPFNPPEWQVQKFHRAETLTKFIAKQIELYQ